MIKKSLISILFALTFTGCATTPVAVDNQPGFAGFTSGPQFTNPNLAFAREEGRSVRLGLNAPSGYALKSITWAERGDRPCYFQARYHKITDPSDVRVSNEIDECNFGGERIQEQHFVTSRKTVELDLLGPSNHFANSIKVCNADRNVAVDDDDTIENWIDSNNTGPGTDVTVDRMRTVRLKGIELNGKSLNSEVTTTSVDKKERPNCEDWSSVSCPAGSVINDLNIRFIPEFSARAQGAQVAIGIQPICARLSTS